jgi:hypothetical protein
MPGKTQLELEEQMAPKIIIPILLAAAWLGNMALAGTRQLNERHPV